MSNHIEEAFRGAGPISPKAETAFVLVEVGSARVTPAIPRDLTSFVHTHLEGLGQLAEFDRNLGRAKHA